MNHDEDITTTDILLARYLSGDADAQEIREAEDWINASGDNRAYFASMKKTWEATAKTAAAPAFNTDAAWEKLQSQMQGRAAAQKSGRIRWSIAAGIALLTGIATLAYLSKNTGPEVQTLQLASNGNLLNDTLPDGSRISLNKNTTLDYPSAFTNETREVSLRGEAFFDVHHDAEHPFIIHTPLMDVQVLGTSFDVIAWPNSDSVFVTVKTGRVQCTANGENVVITPGEYAVYSKDKGRIRKGNDDDPNRAAYRDKIFRFNNTPLFIAVQRLNEAYGCNIVLKNDKLKSCSFSSTKVFKNEPVENIISLIEASIPGITSQKQDANTIVLDGPGCQ